MNIVFAGTPDFAVPSLEFLIGSEHSVVAVYTQPDRAAGRGRRITASSVKNVAQHHKIPVFQPVSLKTSETQAELKSLRPDLMVVAAYGLILPQRVLDIPVLGCINVHASLLPRWRGAAPIHRAIEAGDPESGITIMRMELGLDTGAMLKKKVVPIKKDETTGDLHDRLAQLGAETLASVLPEIENRTITAELQDESQVTYAEKISKNEATIDWSLPSKIIDRKIKAFNPWPVARTKYKGEWMRIWRSQPVFRPAPGIPGTIVSHNRKFMEVSTGEGVLKLLEVQLPGGKRISTEAFLNAHHGDGVVALV